MVTGVVEEKTPDSATYQLYDLGQVTILSELQFRPQSKRMTPVSEAYPSIKWGSCKLVLKHATIIVIILNYCENKKGLSCSEHS